MKVVKIMLICLSFCFIFGIYANAQQDYSALIESTGADELYNSLDEDVKNALDELGINKVDFGNLFDISFENVFNIFKNVFNGSLEAPFKSLTKLLCVIILVSIGESFIPDDDKYKSTIGMISALFCISAVIVPLYQAMESAVSSVTVSGGFMKSLIPVLVGVVSASGNPTLALSFQSIAFSLAQAISLFSEKYVVPVAGAVIAIDLTGSLMPSYKLSGITDLIKKTVTGVMSFIATLYVSFLGIKGALANAADSVANKGIKLIISSAVPVVGSAVSEAYSGIIGSLILVRSTVGIFGIIVIAVITVPAIIQLLFWIFALKIGASVSELFLQGTVSQLLKALSSAITLVNVVLLFNAVLFIISLALVLAIKQ